MYGSIVFYYHTKTENCSVVSPKGVERCSDIKIIETDIEFWERITLILAEMNAEPITFETIHNDNREHSGCRVYYRINPFSPRIIVPPNTLRSDTDS